MISANHRPDNCRDFSRNRDSVMISDELTDSLVSFLKVSYKTKLFISVELLYCFKENQKGENEATDTFITKIPPKRLKECSRQSARNSWCVRSRMNEVSQVERREIYFHKYIFWSRMITRNRAGLYSTLENITTCLVSPWVF